MSTNETENYHLHAWEAGDDFLRSEINENFAALDSAVGGLVVTGKYTGDGTTDRFIGLGFIPRAVLICPADQQMNSGYYYCGGLLVTGGDLLHGSNSSAQIVEGGFQVSHVFLKGSNYSTTITCNKKDLVFHFIALR